MKSEFRKFQIFKSCLFSTPCDPQQTELLRGLAAVLAPAAPLASRRRQGGWRLWQQLAAVTTAGSLVCAILALVATRGIGMSWAASQILEPVLQLIAAMCDSTPPQPDGWRHHYRALPDAQDLTSVVRRTLDQDNGTNKLTALQYGAWRMAHGAWRLALGAWRMAHGAWCMAHLTSPSAS